MYRSVFNPVPAAEVLTETTLLAEVCEDADEADEADDEVEATEMVVTGATLDEVEVTTDVAVLCPLPFLTVEVDVLVEDFVTEVVLYKVVRK